MKKNQKSLKYKHKNQDINKLVENNFKKVKLDLLITPFLILLLFVCFFSFTIDDTFTLTYIESQKNLFLKLNEVLSVYPNFAYNITQLGDVLVIFPFIFIFLFLAPKFWESLLTSSILTLLTSAILKNIFAIPRPAAIIDINTFTIMGRPNILHTSFPSGHSMTAFIVMTVLLYAFLPNKKMHKIFWILILFTLGFAISFSRVAIGAHYPLDVFIGSTLGYIIAVLSIKINTKTNWLHWMKNRRFYPIIMLIFSIWTYFIILRIIKYNLVIFYLSLIALAVTFIVIMYKYVKKTEA